MDAHQAQDNNIPKAPEPNALMAVLAYLGILIVIPFLTPAKDDPFVKFHIKQGLILLIIEIASWFLISMPFFGWFLHTFLWLFITVMIIIGIINAVSGVQKELPLIGQFARNFNF